MDPSMSNWGIVKGVFNPVTKTLVIEAMTVTCPVVTKGKQVRKNSQDMEAAKQLSMQAYEALKTADIVTVEVPHGSQSARAMASYGICIGILGMLSLSKVPIIQVNANETRIAITGKREASKAQAIAWAMEKHPEAPWPYYKEKGQMVLSAAKAEHMADAIASIYAAMETDMFKTMAMLASKD